jgi:hypothetical protein
MPIAFSAAKIRVAQSLGGQGDADERLAAGTAINEAIGYWNRNNVWGFCLTDNLSDNVITSQTHSSTTVDLPAGITYPNFASVYVGTKVSGSGIPAGATVTAKASNSSITISAAATTTLASTPLTFSGPIPIISGQSDYALPYQFYQPSYARLVTSNTTLTFARSRFINQVSDPTASGGTWGYEIITVQGPVDANNVFPAPTSVLRLVATPLSGTVGSVVDTLIFESYRFIQPFLNDLSTSDEARPVDVPDLYVYALLDYAEYVYMRNKDAESPRTADRKQNAMQAFNNSVDADSGVPDDIECFLPQIQYDMTRRHWGPAWWNL